MERFIVKKKIVLGCTVGVLVILIVLGMHWTTFRYLDQNGASIVPDQSTRLAHILRTSHQDGYRLKKVAYHHSQHMIVGTYVPRRDPRKVIHNAKYIGVTFQPTTVPIQHDGQADPAILERHYNRPTSGRDTLRLIVGDRFNRYRVVSANYPALSVRDPSIMRQGKRYFIIYTRGLLSTTDFSHWQEIKWPADHGFSYSQDWAPEFVGGSKGRTWVVMSKAHDSYLHHQLYLTAFIHHRVGRQWTRLQGNFPENVIDPHIQYYHGKYYLFCKDERRQQLMMGTAPTATGTYQMHHLDLGPGYKEGVEALVSGNQIWLYFDTMEQTATSGVVYHGLHYATSDLAGRHWSTVRPLQSPIILRHGEIIKNK